MTSHVGRRVSTVVNLSAEREWSDAFRGGRQGPVVAVEELKSPISPSSHHRIVVGVAVKALNHFRHGRCEARQVCVPVTPFECALCACDCALSPSGSEGNSEVRRGTLASGDVPQTGFRLGDGEAGEFRWSIRRLFCSLAARFSGLRKRITLEGYDVRDPPACYPLVIVRGTRADAEFGSPVWRPSRAPNHRRTQRRSRIGITPQNAKRPSEPMRRADIRSAAMCFRSESVSVAGGGPGGSLNENDVSS